MAAGDIGATTALVVVTDNPIGPVGEIVKDVPTADVDAPVIVNLVGEIQIEEEHAGELLDR